MLSIDDKILHSSSLIRYSRISSFINFFFKCTPAAFCLVEDDSVLPLWSDDQTSEQFFSPSIFPDYTHAKPIMKITDKSTVVHYSNQYA